MWDRLRLRVGVGVGVGIRVGVRVRVAVVCRDPPVFVEVLHLLARVLVRLELHLSDLS